MITAQKHKNTLQFKLDCKDISYVFQTTKYLHLENVYLGHATDDFDFSLSKKKNNAGYGSSVCYSQDDSKYCLDDILLEYSGIGKGDFRNSPIEIRMPQGGFVTDFLYQGYEIKEGAPSSETLPMAIDEEKNEEVQTLKIFTKDQALDVFLTLEYVVFPLSNVVARRVIIENKEKKSLEIRKIMSMMLDIDQTDFDMVSFDGGWIKEGHRNETPISEGIHIISSTTGASSNRHNPGIILKKKNATEDTGLCFGFNLIYSGNHYTAIEKSPNGTLRVENGINPHCFSFELNENEIFETPQSVLTFSFGGVNGLSKNFHSFVKKNIVRGEHKSKDRPVLINGWEAFMFDFTQSKLVSLAKQAAKLGVEMFVLDDGWFGKRDNDRAGLGDYSFNKKKLPRGLKPLIKKIHALGMKFGLWFEPEMINIESELYKKHPDWIVAEPGRTPSFGRNQLVLDLTNESVRNYIVENVNSILRTNNIDYVKWDMNRHTSDMYSKTLHNQGEFFHAFVLGLYDILKRITLANPTILFESCSSGGNRFDLGMLCYMPQVWTSDNTDPIERLKIQGGLSCLYPPSTFGAHVSMTPHAQTLRSTPLSTRFNVASFGLLGYELDFAELTREEKKEIKEQIAFYKKYRKTFQFGEFKREIKHNRIVWQVKDDSTIIVGNFQKGIGSAPEGDVLFVKDLDMYETYTVRSKAQRLPINRFGSLIKHVLPVTLKSDGFILRMINSYYSLQDAIEEYQVSGAQLLSGIRLNQQFTGTHYDTKTRLLGDFGSTLYVIEKTKHIHKEGKHYA